MQMIHSQVRVEELFMMSVWILFSGWPYYMWLVQVWNINVMSIYCVEQPDTTITTISRDLLLTIFTCLFLSSSQSGLNISSDPSLNNAFLSCHSHMNTVPQSGRLILIYSQKQSALPPSPNSLYSLKHRVEERADKLLMKWNKNIFIPQVAHHL